MRERLGVLAGLTLLLLTTAVRAAEPVYEASAAMAMDSAYPAVREALEERRFFVVFEANMGDTLARFAERWGEDYNRNALDGIRSMVVCNAWYTNQVSNLDPRMLALCPLRVVLVSKEGTTRALFARPTAVAGDSPAARVLKEAEETIIEAIREGLGAAPDGSP